MKEEYLEIEEFKRVKTFMFSMNLFDLSLKERQKHLADKRITLAEKQIINCTIMLRDCNYQEIINLLSKQTHQNILVESQRLLILGIALASAGDMGKAIPCLTESQNIFSKYKLNRYEFYSWLHLFFSYYNLKDSNKMATCLDHMMACDPDNTKDKLSVLRCQFNFNIFNGEFKKAKIFLNKIEKQIEFMHPAQYSFHLIDKFVYYLKINDFNKCESTIKEMTKSRLFYSSENYNFIKTLFNHFYHNNPIYLYEQDFKETPLLLYQLKFLKALEGNNKEAAILEWQKLSEISPNIYCENLNYKGDKCLFSLCLEKYKSSLISQAPDISLNSSLTKEEKLLYILEQAQGPVSKEILYQKIWNSGPQDKADFGKLTILVFRLKKDKKLNIISRKGCYWYQKSS